MPTSPPADHLSPFLDRWRAATGTERANHQLFVTQLCDLLELSRPDPATGDNAQNAYVFERRVDFHNPDGTTDRGYMDCYRRGCFVLEAKHTGKEPGAMGWDKAMLRAHGQAVAYARALPKTEGRPPFVITLDVGVALEPAARGQQPVSNSVSSVGNDGASNVIIAMEMYSEFTQSGGAYIPYPDPRSHRIRIEKLRDPAIRERLRKIWTDPLALDPTWASARVTRDIATRLAKLAKSLEQSGDSSKPVAPAQVASFLMRAIFTMFAEDVGLIDDHAFTELLESISETPEHFAPLVEELWQKMNSGGFSTTIRKKILQFNGGLFADPSALNLDKQQIALLIEAARADWRNVEPAIFGTLLERALDPRERHNLPEKDLGWKFHQNWMATRNLSEIFFCRPISAHYTPRAYVERLVMPTIIEPLRIEWDNTKTTALILDQQGKNKKAIEAIQAFHIRLCGLRILDPACGSGCCARQCPSIVILVGIHVLLPVLGRLRVLTSSVGKGRSSTSWNNWERPKASWRCKGSPWTPIDFSYHGP
uniref:site-specific DNA-methyltransferase (adenine-specific) n=1 Tax=Candidatus Kentrum sp. FM TaxID=2126340 RepID=A0A450WC61_9GAMM|nr:MAG: hypothetical protein BECKFM1743C_GA0114222_100359 [Candidatus Kentron sp. FM]VFJ46249.1 MAG: hypothetical protein BECKFM1743A_GA0114220_100345 [Candidatus Kentron sp. FM]VFK14614.1 MAG: hypothetical protein BECKFM1743B_GA0114221_103301 [Candidatus Kentron sp. FM]